MGKEKKWQKRDQLPLPTTLESSLNGKKQQSLVNAREPNIIQSQCPFSCLERFCHENFPAMVFQYFFLLLLGFLLCIKNYSYFKIQDLASWKFHIFEHWIHWWFKIRHHSIAQWIRVLQSIKYLPFLYEQKVHSGLFIVKKLPSVSHWGQKLYSFCNGYNPAVAFFSYLDMTDTLSGTKLISAQCTWDLEK